MSMDSAEWEDEETIDMGMDSLSPAKKGRKRSRPPTIPAPPNNKGGKGSREKAASTRAPALSKAGGCYDARKKACRPRAAAVGLLLPPEAIEGSLTYAQLLKMAKGRIALEELGITALWTRNAFTGQDH